MRMMMQQLQQKTTTHSATYNPKKPQFFSQCERSERASEQVYHSKQNHQHHTPNIYLSKKQEDDVDDDDDDVDDDEMSIEEKEISHRTIRSIIVQIFCVWSSHFTKSSSWSSNKIFKHW
jgi:hypothetical protein